VRRGNIEGIDTLDFVLARAQTSYEPAPGDVVAVVEDGEGLHVGDGGRRHDAVDEGRLADKGTAAELGHVSGNSYRGTRGALAG